MPETITSRSRGAFNEWLRGQLRARRMSQRQLAQRSGVDHTTICRLLRGDRVPSLGTATKLARGLREVRDDAEAATYLPSVVSGAANPAARVEYALRADELLSEAAVHELMELYLAARTRAYRELVVATGRSATPEAPLRAVDLAEAAEPFRAA